MSLLETTTTSIDSIVFIIKNTDAYTDIKHFVQDNGLIQQKNYKLGYSNDSFKQFNFLVKDNNKVVFSYYKYEYKDKSTHQNTKYTKLAFHGLKSYDNQIDTIRMNALFALFEHLLNKGHKPYIAQLDIALDIPTDMQCIMVMRTNTKGIPRNKQSESDLTAGIHYVEADLPNGRKKSNRACLYNKGLKSSLNEEMTRFEISIKEDGFRQIHKDCHFYPYYNIDLFQKYLLDEIIKRTSYYKVIQFDTIEECSDAIKVFDDNDMKWNPRTRKKLNPLIEGMEVRIDEDVILTFIKRLYKTCNPATMSIQASIANNHDLLNVQLA
jgi:hypothetical protein